MTKTLTKLKSKLGRYMCAVKRAETGWTCAVDGRVEDVENNDWEERKCGCGGDGREGNRGG